MVKLTSVTLTHVKVNSINKKTQVLIIVEIHAIQAFLINSALFFLGYVSCYSNVRQINAVK